MKRIALLLLFMLLVGCATSRNVLLPKKSDKSELVIPTPQPNNNAGIKQQYKIPR